MREKKTVEKADGSGEAEKERRRIQENCAYLTSLKLFRPSLKRAGRKRSAEAATVQTM